MRESRQTTRRTAIRNGLALVTGAVGAFASSAEVRAQEKIAQAQVQYQAMPKDGAKCSTCVNWVAPNACQIVAGTINPNGWCVAYAPKEG